MAPRAAAPAMAPLAITDPAAALAKKPMKYAFALLGTMKHTHAIIAIYNAMLFLCREKAYIYLFLTNISDSIEMSQSNVFKLSYGAIFMVMRRY